MLGAITGDIVGSRFEAIHTKQKDFELFHRLCRFTDDTVLTVAIADAILKGEPYAAKLKQYARRYPFRGYGMNFLTWALSSSDQPYYSLGNGSAMRVSPVGWAFDTEEKVLDEAEKSAACTHSHPEGIKGAQAIALAIYLARMGADKETIRHQIQHRFGYDLNRTVDEIRPNYHFDVTCPGSVPEAIIAFLDSVSFEDAIRNAVSLGGDADTQADMAGAIAEAYYGPIPAHIVREVWQRIPEAFQHVVLEFYSRFIPSHFRALQAAVDAQA